MPDGFDFNVEELTITDIQAAFKKGTLTSAQLTEMYIHRIGMYNFELGAVIEVNKDAVEIAEGLDKEYKAGKIRGPLHGVPILLKDNIGTADRMETTAGSWALIGSKPYRDATVAAKLRKAGAVLLGKANLSQWANWRSRAPYGVSTNSWSSRGGYCHCPYNVTTACSGSSSGSGAAPAANLVFAALGSETDGSIVSPAQTNGIVGLKPTIGLTSRAGVVPISRTQDVVGPMARTLSDAVKILDAIVQRDGEDQYDAGYTKRCIGKIPKTYTTYLTKDSKKSTYCVAQQMIALNSTNVNYQRPTFESAINLLKKDGATIKYIDIPTYRNWTTSSFEQTVLHYEFKQDIKNYISGLEFVPTGVKDLTDLIAYNIKDPREQNGYFNQTIWYASEATDGLDSPVYKEALAGDFKFAAGIDEAFNQNKCDAILTLTSAGASTAAAIGGYPIITVPVGVNANKVPFGIAAFGPACSEPGLIKAAYAVERVAGTRKPPTYPFVGGPRNYTAF
ncbi:hypothetical protein HK097_006866 [Rhizophlyctis rosea]|uniref:Amidase domain-containing protein n=1 Tax=Rhizophlyctis rosea TaxID=64517 RepID=A0AAD5SE82_9FUNG|nr:hypothetical protein HK097_006866 [Rhizophlyctis rosea]